MLVLLNCAQGLREGHTRGQWGPTSCVCWPHGDRAEGQGLCCAAKTVDSIGTRAETLTCNTPNSEPAPVGRAAEAPACLPLRSPALSPPKAGPQSEVAERAPRSPWGRCPRPEGRCSWPYGGAAAARAHGSRAEWRSEGGEPFRGMKPTVSYAWCFHGWVFACYLQIGVFERQAATYETWFRGVCWLDGVSQQVG